jgi:hypothetical protein
MANRKRGVMDSNTRNRGNPSGAKTAKTCVLQGTVDSRALAETICEIA